MKYEHYIVTFTNGKTVFATCIGAEEAEILAKATMIKHGYTREVKSIRKVSAIDIANADFVL